MTEPMTLGGSAGSSSMTCTPNRRRTVEEPGNITSIASVSRAASTLWAGHGQRCGSSPELAVQYELGYPTEVVDVHMRHEHGGDRVGIDPLPRQRNEAGRAAVEQDTSVGSADRWIQACNRPPLPIASPGPANVTVTLAVSPSLI